MKKLIIFLIIFVSIFAFYFLLHYGFKHTRGIPVLIEELKRPILEVPSIDKEIDLDKGIDIELWNSLPTKEIKLLYQVMILPWPKVITPLVKVKAFHNSKDIYFYLEWQDDTEDKILGINKFSDASAIMFPLDENVQTPSLMMGFLGRANIWHWKASRDREFWLKEDIEGPKTYVDWTYPFEEKETLSVSKELVKSAVNDLVAIRVGTVTTKETQNVEGRGFYNGGVWKVVFKRSIQELEPDLDAKFEINKKRLCAFAAWNGSKGDRGGRKSISDWVELEIK